MQQLQCGVRFFLIDKVYVHDAVLQATAEVPVIGTVESETESQGGAAKSQLRKLKGVDGPLSSTATNIPTI